LLHCCESWSTTAVAAPFLLFVQKLLLKMEVELACGWVTVFQETNALAHERILKGYTYRFPG